MLASNTERSTTSAGVGMSSIVVGSGADISRVKHAGVSDPVTSRRAVRIVGDDASAVPCTP
jgi:hypothetical protein